MTDGAAAEKLSISRKQSSFSESRAVRGKRGCGRRDGATHDRSVRLLFLD
jgi:hypothetical protein